MSDAQASDDSEPLPTSPQQLLDRLATLGIATETVTHERVNTVAEAQALRGQLTGGHTKNLFLRDKKKNLWLVVAREDRPVDLKALGRVCGARLSFGGADLLWETLGVRPGAVTPFGAINDTAGRVRIILDADLLAEARLWFHPLDNTMSTAIGPQDLVAFLRDTGHDPDVRTLDAGDEAGQG